MSDLPRLDPLALIELPGPFDDSDFIFEVKFDGYRALAYVEEGSCELVSRKGHTYTRFENLKISIAADLKAKSAILDGEIVCLDGQGRSQFYHLMFNRSEPYLYAFDLLWLDGVDLRELPLLERKAKLKKVIPASSRLLYLDHIARSYPTRLAAGTISHIARELRRTTGLYPGVEASTSVNLACTPPVQARCRTGFVTPSCFQLSRLRHTWAAALR